MIIFSKRLSLILQRTLLLPDEGLGIVESADGRLIAVSLLDNTARVYFNDSLKFFLSLYGHSLPVHCIDMSSDAELAVTGSADKSVKIWGLDFGDCHKSLFAHDDRFVRLLYSINRNSHFSVTNVKFVPKSHLFWSAGKDGKIRQWDADCFVKIQTLNGHSAEIWSLAISNNGRYLVSTSHDKSVRLWEQTEEIIVLNEEEEMERELEYDKTIVETEDVVGYYVCITF
jgi:U3 small nucleolar RNA-associated protein 12